jgi:Sigma-70 region 2
MTRPPSGHQAEPRDSRRGMTAHRLLPPGRRTENRFGSPQDQDQEKAMATNPTLTQQASSGRDDPVVTGLVTRARNGDRQAWDALVDRYAPLIWSICRRYRLDAADAQDAAQNVWLKLVDHLDGLRDPAALPGWLATTTRRECGRIARAARRPCDAGYALAAGTIPDDHAQAAGRTCSRPNGTRPCVTRSGSCPRAASSCSPCSSKILRCRTRRSAPGWASRSAASGRAAAAAWTSCAATRPSPR